MAQSHNSGFMISTKKYADTTEMINILNRNQNYMKKRFWKYKLSVNRSLLWVSIYISEYHYSAIKSHIKELLKHLNIKISSFPTVHTSNEGAKYTQLQAFHSSAHRINELHEWIIANNYNYQEPILRRTTTHNSYHVKWNIPINIKADDIINHWTAHHTQTNIRKCETTKYIANLKDNAILALNQMFKYALSQYQSNNTNLYKHSRFITHTLVNKKDVPHLDISKIPNLIQKFPFLQFFAPHIQPFISSIFKIKKLKIAFMNINGNARTKINHDHPYLHQLLYTHNPDILIFIDTRVKNIPNWKLNGFKLIAYKPPTSTDDYIGGILIYRKYNISNKIKIIQKTHSYNTIWISISTNNYEAKPIYLSVNYIRPMKATNIPRNTKYFKNLINDTNKYKSQCSEMYIVGDFNARLPTITDDRVTNAHSNLMLNFLDKTNVKIANPFWAPNVLTCLAKTKNGGGSIIDYVTTDNLTNISDLRIDPHPIFTDHRPVIFTLNNVQCHTYKSDKHYILSKRKPNKNLLIKHESILNHALPYIQSLNIQFNDNISKNDKKYLSNVVSLCTMYIIQRATIKTFGLIDANSINKWINTNIKQASLNLKQHLISQYDNVDKTKINELISQYKLNHENTQKLIISRNTTRFNNLPHSQKLHQYKSLHNKLKFNDDEPYLKVNNQWTPKDEALRNHYQNICGPISDPPNPNIQQINRFNHSLNQHIPNTLQFEPYNLDKMNQFTPPTCLCANTLHLILSNENGQNITCSHCENVINCSNDEEPVYYQCKTECIFNYKICISCYNNIDEDEDDDDIMNEMNNDPRFSVNNAINIPIPKNLHNESSKSKPSKQSYVRTA